MTDLQRGISYAALMYALAVGVWVVLLGLGVRARRANVSSRGGAWC